MSILGAFVLILLAIARVEWILKNGVTTLAVLLLMQSGLGAVLMIFRRAADITAPKWVEAGAWLSAMLPILFFTPTTASTWYGLLPIPGLVLNLWALACLGKTFGIGPAHRGLVLDGPYRWLRHPMYAGELLSLAGGLIGAFGIWNLVLFMFFTATIVWRIFEEEKILRKNGYAAYAGLVKWRLIPGLW